MSLLKSVGCAMAVAVDAAALSFAVEVVRYLAQVASKPLVMVPSCVFLDVMVGTRGESMQVH